VGQPGAAEAGVKLLCDGAAADTGSALQDERLKPSLGEIKRGNQPVVAGPENYDVARLRHR
jgi:hypothetical protein